MKNVIVKFAIVSISLLCLVPSHLLVFGLSSHAYYKRIFTETFDKWANKYPVVEEAERRELIIKTREMFTFGYDNYLRYAFPMDELDPIHCVGRGPDYDVPTNININDVLGDYCLSLVDSLDTLAVMGNVSEFHRAVRLVIEYVSFEKDLTVQVFEATIRVLGSLLSAHLILTDSSRLLGYDFRMPDYNDELLTMAHDLASRLLPSFEGTRTGLPYPRVNLGRGVVPREKFMNRTCTSGAGSLLLEFGVLSRLLGDPTYEWLARRTNDALWRLRDEETGLLGNVVDIQTGEWLELLSGLGAGLDSFYEYLLKAYILFGSRDDYKMFNQSYNQIRSFLRKGRPHCDQGWGDPPLYVNVHMSDGSVLNTWIDSLQASFSGVQILNGDLEEAICQHALYYSIWKKYGVLPERFNWKLKAPDVRFYPLRPEFAESTYLLYQSTKNPFYLRVGAEIVESLNTHTRVQCGYATVHDVHDKSLEDRMESFFLSETCKYLFLLFDHDNPVNKNYSRLIFTTEGHILPIDKRFREPVTESDTTEQPPKPQANQKLKGKKRTRWRTKESESINPHLLKNPKVTNDTSFDHRRHPDGDCEIFPFSRRYVLPLQSHYLSQLFEMVGVHDNQYPYDEDDYDDGKDEL